MSRTYLPHDAQAIKDAFLLAKQTFSRPLTKDEDRQLARQVVDLATPGAIDVQKLATRAVVRLLR